MEEKLSTFRTQFFTLLEELQHHIVPNPNSPNHRALPASKKLAITLYYLKDTGSLPRRVRNIEFPAIIVKPKFCGQNPVLDGSLGTSYFAYKSTDIMEIRYFGRKNWREIQRDQAFSFRSISNLLCKSARIPEKFNDIFAFYATNQEINQNGLTFAPIKFAHGRVRKAQVRLSGS